MRSRATASGIVVAASGCSGKSVKSMKRSPTVSAIAALRSFSFTRPLRASTIGNGSPVRRDSAVAIARSSRLRTWRSIRNSPRTRAWLDSMSPYRPKADRSVAAAGSRSRPRAVERESRDDAEDLLEGGVAEADLAQAVGAQRDHALHHRDLLQVVRRSALDDQLLDLLGDRHDLVEREPAPVAGLAALAAADRAVEDRPVVAVDLLHRPPGLHQLGLGGLVRLLAPVAELPREALGQHAVQRARHEERLDPHLDEAQRRRSCVVGVQRGEDEVTGERGLDRD